MNKKLLSAIFTLALPSVMLASPAKRELQLKVQPNGATLELTLCGDENFHYYLTADGVPVMNDSDGYFKYLTVDTKGKLQISSFIAKEANARTEEEKTLIGTITSENFNKAVFSKASQSPFKGPQTRAIGNFPTEGNVKGIILLVEFSDVRFNETHTQPVFNDMMNKEGYTDFNASGSARDYYMAQSSGKFTPEFDVVGPITLSNPMAYYGQNDYWGTDKNPDGMIYDACVLAASDHGVDFSKYDQNSDGTVDLVYVVYAGYGEAQGGPATSIWPHKWSMARKNLTLNGVNFDEYACSCELSGSSGSNLDGVGTFCHEFSHCLGLPDLYDTGRNTNFGMGYWDVMGMGCYLNDSRTPPSYSASERSFVNWIDLVELENPENIAIPAINTDNQAYVIYNPNNRDEFITFENRQLTGWDSYLPNSGLLITRVKYDESVWNNNSVNASPGEQFVKIFPADNKLALYNSTFSAYWEDMRGDTYPGTKGNTQFTSTSTPVAAFRDGTLVEKPITGITEENGIVYMEFMKPEIAIPTALEATDVTESGFRANWDILPGATSYILEFNPLIHGELYFSEDCSLFTSGSVEKPNTMDISSNLNKYMTQPGWTGSLVFQAGRWCKIGSTSNKGYIASPVSDLSLSGGFATLCFTVMGNSTIEEGLAVVLSSDAKGQNVIEQKKYDLSTNETRITVKFYKGNDNCYLSIQPGAIAFIKDIKLYTGLVENEPENADNVSTETTEYRDLTDNSYLISGLDTSIDHVYRVRALVDGFVSDYSNAVIVSTKGTTGIGSDLIMDDIKNKIHITTVKSAIHITTVKAATVNVYSITGSLIESKSIAPGEHSVPVQRGMYLISVDNESKKVVVTE